MRPPATMWPPIRRFEAAWGWDTEWDYCLVMHRLLAALAAVLLASPVMAVDYLQCEAMRRRHSELQSAYLQAIRRESERVCGRIEDAMELDRIAKWRQENPQWKEKKEVVSGSPGLIPPLPAPSLARSSYLPRTVAEYAMCAKNYPPLIVFRSGPVYYSYSKSYRLPSYIIDLENRHNRVLRDIKQGCP
jgi:hypothetical protein